MWFREAFNDQINPSWQNVHLEQLDLICEKIEAQVDPAKKSKPVPRKSSSPGFEASQQYFYQNVGSFFDNDENDNVEHTLYSFSNPKLTSSSASEETSLLFSHKQQQGPQRVLRPSSHALASPTPSNIAQRALLQREQSLVVLQSAATPLNSLSPQLQKLETLYSATFLAEVEQVSSFFKFMQSRVQSEILLLFAKCIEVLKIKYGLFTPTALRNFFATHRADDIDLKDALRYSQSDLYNAYSDNKAKNDPNDGKDAKSTKNDKNETKSAKSGANKLTAIHHPLIRCYLLCQHFLTLFEHFNQPMLLSVGSMTSLIELDMALIKFSNFHLGTTSNMYTDHTRPFSSNSNPNALPSALDPLALPTPSMSSVSGLTPAPHNPHNVFLQSIQPPIIHNINEKTNKQQSNISKQPSKPPTQSNHNTTSSEDTPTLYHSDQTTTTLTLPSLLKGDDSSSSKTPTTATSTWSDDPVRPLVTDLTLSGSNVPPSEFYQLSPVSQNVSPFTPSTYQALHEQTIQNTIQNVHNAHQQPFNSTSTSTSQQQQQQQQQQTPNPNSTTYNATTMPDTHIEDEVSSIELSFRELSRCLHLLTSYIKLNKSALLHSLDTHDNTGTPLKLSHQMGGQVNRTEFSLYGLDWSGAVTSLIVEFYSAFFEIPDKKRAWKLLKSQAVVDQIQEPKLNSILAMFGTSIALILTICVLLYNYPETHVWLLTVLPLWRFSTFIVTFLFGLATLIYYCIKTNINYIFLFGLNPLNAYTHKSLYFHAASFAAITALCMLVCLIFRISDIHSLMFLPHTILTLSFVYYFYVNRSYLLKSIKAFVFCEATFQSSWVGDQMCSLTRLLGDLLYISIFYIHCILDLHSADSVTTGTSVLLDNSTSTISNTTLSDLSPGFFNVANSTLSTHQGTLLSSHSALVDQSVAMGLQIEVRVIVKQFMWFITVTPFVLRAVQCIRSYYHQSNFNPRHLGNTAKYLAAITMSTFALLYKQALSFAPKITRATNAIGLIMHESGSTGDATTSKASFFIPFVGVLFSSGQEAGKSAQMQLSSAAPTATSQIDINTVHQVVSNVTAQGSPLDDIASIGEIYTIWINELQWIFLISAIATTLFQLIWDFYVDWGLFETGKYWPFRKKTIFRKNFLRRMGKLPNANKDPASALGDSSTPNRSILHTSRASSSTNKSYGLFGKGTDPSHPLTIIPTTRSQYKALNRQIGYIYVSAMVANVLMRLLWIETLLPWNSVSFFSWSAYSSYLTTDFTVLILGIIEILRRCLWSYFRLEAQQVNNNAEYMPVHFKIPEIHTQQLLLLSANHPGPQQVGIVSESSNSNAIPTLNETSLVSLNPLNLLRLGSSAAPAATAAAASGSGRTGDLSSLTALNGPNFSSPCDSNLSSANDSYGRLDLLSPQNSSTTTEANQTTGQAPIRFNRTSSLLFSPETMYQQAPRSSNTNITANNNVSDNAGTKSTNYNTASIFATNPPTSTNDTNSATSTQHSRLNDVSQPDFFHPFVKPGSNNSDQSNAVNHKSTDDRDDGDEGDDDISIDLSKIL